MTSLTKKETWQALVAHRKTMGNIHMRDLFAEDPERFNRFNLEDNGLFLDYSKHRITNETIELLMDLARDCHVEDWRERMFEGDKINTSEDRAVLHTALRCPQDKCTIPFVHDVLDKMKDFSDSVRNGTWTGYTGKSVKNVISIGIGGSGLGPKMICEALKINDSRDITLHFVSNIDKAHITEALAKSDPDTTLFVIASKSFTTQETMENAAIAKTWILNHLKDEKAIERHFIALSTNEQAVHDFGIAPENIFPFKDWVGGRYSLWSAIGLPICLAVGFKNFRALLDGAHSMDKHFRETPLEQNMPVILALLGIWYRNFWDAQSYAVLPYSQHLRSFPDWLQQVDMESNGKNIDREGHPVTYETGPVVFGAPGTDCQHSFFQLIHQGTTLIPCDFIAARDKTAEQKILLANMIAQSQALMQGQTLKNTDDEPYRTFEGNRPSTTILLDKLDPFHLGMLLALYEHKIFVQGIIWNINSFDQWGVELGKTLAVEALNIIEGSIKENGEENGVKNIDSSTAALLAQITRPS